MNSFLTIGIVALALSVGLLTLARLLFGRRATSLPYSARPTLLTPAELNFYTALRQATASDYALFAKVRLADLIEVQRGLPRPAYYRAFNWVAAKHVDFVLCDPATSKLFCAIELDDASHARPDRQRRDRFLDDALTAAGLPLLRIRAQRSYSVAGLRQQLDTIGASSAAAQGAESLRSKAGNL